MAFQKFEGLTQLHRNLDHVIVTAHRGASGSYPENTLLAMRKAVGWGVDMIEFDVRATRDGVPVVLHDPTMNRTSDLEGRPEDYDWATLQCGNFSYYRFGYQHDTGKRLNFPAYEKMPIPSLEMIFQEFRGKAGMNIQLYTDAEVVPEICRLYKQYHMYDQGYLTIADLKVIEQVRKIDSKIEICFTPPWMERGTLARLNECKNLGCRFVQPVVEHTGPDCYRYCKELGLRANAFFVDTDLTVRLLIAQGADGILSNRADIVCDTLKELGKW